MQNMSNNMSINMFNMSNNMSSMQFRANTLLDVTNMQNMQNNMHTPHFADVGSESERSSLVLVTTRSVWSADRRDSVATEFGHPPAAWPVTASQPSSVVTDTASESPSL